MFGLEKNIQVNKKYELEDQEKYAFLEKHLRSLNYSNAGEKEFENMLIEIEKIGYDIKKAAAIVFKIAQEKELKIIELEEENKKLREKDKQSQAIIPLLLEKAKQLEIENEEVLLLEGKIKLKDEPGVLSKTVYLLQDKIEKKWISKRIFKHIEKNPLDKIYAELSLEKIYEALGDETLSLKKLYNNLKERKKEREKKNKDKDLWGFKNPFGRKK